jgi:hypothetical protein
MARIVCGRIITVGDGRVIKEDYAKAENRREAAYRGLEAEGIIRAFDVLDLDDRLTKRRTTIKLSEPCLVYEQEDVPLLGIPAPEKTQMYVPLLNLSHVVSLE